LFHICIVIVCLSVHVQSIMYFEDTITMYDVRTSTVLLS